MKFLFDKSPTLGVIVGLLSLVGILAVYYFTNPLYGSICLALGIYEAYTFVNKFTGDTLSEEIARLTSRATYLLLWIGMVVGWLTRDGFFGDPITAGRGIIIGMLLGHWFWRLRID